MSVDFDPSRVITSYTHTHPDGDKKNYEYNKYLERDVALACFGDKVIKFAPDGYHPEWDFVTALIDIEKIDQKLKCGQMMAGDMLEIEIYRDNRILKSALLLTTADYYMTLTQEWNKGRKVVKVRLVSVPLLKLEGKQAIADKRTHFEINSFNFPHVWVGDFLVNEDNTWNVTKLIRTNPNLLQHLKEYKQQEVEIISQL